MPSQQCTEVSEERRCSRFSAALKLHGISAMPDELALSINAKDADAGKTALKAIATEPSPSGEVLATQLLDLAREKFDPYLNQDLLRRSAASAYLQPERLPEIAQALLAGCPLA